VAIPNPLRGTDEAVSGENLGGAPHGRRLIRSRSALISRIWPGFARRDIGRPIPYCHDRAAFDEAVCSPPSAMVAGCQSVLMDARRLSTAVGVGVDPARGVGALHSRPVG
jgi:hypothetical protein